MSRKPVLGRLWLAPALALLGLLCGCGERDARRGSGSTPKLVLISPHNDNIRQEFGDAFSAWHEAHHGTPVSLEWRDVGGGTSAIVQYLRNVYARTDSAEIDLLWGGGEQPFIALAEEGVFTPIALTPDALAQIPETFGGVRLRDEHLRWCGSAISGFGFLYNRALLRMRNLPPPKVWADLADNRMFGLVALADPTQSGSAAAAYEMIVQSAGDWPEGWRKLLLVLGNANRFYDSAGDAANAPVLGEAMVATCIDFYGAVRVKNSPDTLVYVSPAGETAYSPDPIALLKNPPNPELARRFVEFVLSAQGQALWAVRPGEEGGPRRYALGRQPIRQDVYATFADTFSPWISHPYEAGHEMALDIDMKLYRAEALKYLVRCAAIDNLASLKRARQRVAGLAADDPLMQTFARLPADAATPEGLAKLAERLKNPGEAERIVTAWQAFFREQFHAVSR